MLKVIVGSVRFRHVRLLVAPIVVVGKRSFAVPSVLQVAADWFLHLAPIAQLALLLFAPFFHDLLAFQVVIEVHAFQVWVFFREHGVQLQAVRQVALEADKLGLVCFIKLLILILELLKGLVDA